MESLQAQWERKTFNDYDLRCCEQDAYERALGAEIDRVEDDICSNDEGVILDLINILEEDEDLLDLIARDKLEQVQNQRDKAVITLAEERIEQNKKDWENGYVID